MYALCTCFNGTAWHHQSSYCTLRHRALYSYTRTHLFYESGTKYCAVIGALVLTESVSVSVPCDQYTTPRHWGGSGGGGRVWTVSELTSASSNTNPFLTSQHHQLLFFMTGNRRYKSVSALRVHKHCCRGYGYRLFWSLFQFSGLYRMFFFSAGPISAGQTLRSALCQRCVVHRGGWTFDVGR